MIMLGLNYKMVKMFINNHPTSFPQESGLEKISLTNPGCWLEQLPLDSWNRMNRAVTLLAQYWCGGAKEEGTPGTQLLHLPE